MKLSHADAYFERDGIKYRARAEESINDGETSVVWTIDRVTTDSLGRALDFEEFDYGEFVGFDSKDVFVVLQQAVNGKYGSFDEEGK